MKYLYCFLFTILSVAVVAQSENTVGLLSYNDEMSYDGYTLIYPHNQPDVFLLNNCGEIVQTWEGIDDMKPGNVAYLLENGNIVITSRPSSVANDPIWAGGGGATIELRTWDNEVLSSFTRNDSTARIHHDLEVLPNGNVLSIMWEYRSREEAVAAGRDTNNITEDALWPDNIIEIDMNTGDIVWEWKVWDHLIQDFDESKENFGVVGDHPELIDINWDTNDGKADWMHTNSIDYHPLYQQIMISVPTFHEVWVIDHTTTTEQAAGSTGGAYGRGGDLIYRWGNPATYRAGDSTDQKLFYQHDPHWNLEFISPGHPDFSKVAVFNNRVGSDFSTVNIFDPMFDDYDGQYMIMDGQYIPAEFDLTMMHPEPQRMWSTGLSSFQQLPNDNYLITVGRFGYSFEITPDQEIVWEYITPIRGGVPVDQGETLEINNNLTFRSFRYPMDYEAFVDRDLTPKGWIENSPNEDYCDQLVSTNDVTLAEVKLYPVPAHHKVMISLEDIGGSLQVFSLSGQLMYTQPVQSPMVSIDVSDWSEGVYFVKVDGTQTGRIIVSK